MHGITFDCDLKMAIPSERGPTRPKNIAIDKIIFPHIERSAVIPIDKPTVPSADAGRGGRPPLKNKNKGWKTVLLTLKGKQQL